MYPKQLIIIRNNYFWVSDIILSHLSLKNAKNNEFQDLEFGTTNYCSGGDLKHAYVQLMGEHIQFLNPCFKAPVPYGWVNQVLTEATHHTNTFQFQSSQNRKKVPHPQMILFWNSSD